MLLEIAFPLSPARILSCQMQSGTRGKNKIGKDSNPNIKCKDGEAGGGTIGSSRRRGLLQTSSSPQRKLVETSSTSYSSETSMGSFSIQILIFTPKIEDGSDVISHEILKDYLNFATNIHTKTVTVKDENGNDVTASLNDLCSKIKPPKNLDMFTTLIPCTRITVLDCFKEGGYDFGKIAPMLPLLHEMNSEIRDDYGVVGYGNLPSLKDKNTDLHQVITNGCRGFARKVDAMKWEETMILCYCIFLPFIYWRVNIWHNISRRWSRCKRYCTK